MVLHAYPGAAGPGQSSVCAAAVDMPAKWAAAVVERQDPSLGSVQGESLGQTTRFTAQAGPAALESAVKAAFPEAPIVSCGATVTAFKGTGGWAQIAEQWQLSRRQGWQAVAHATPVSTAHAAHTDSTAGTDGTDSAQSGEARSPMVAAGTDHCLIHDSSSTMVGSAGSWLAVVRREGGGGQPMVVAETPDLVALASDYAHLAGLPGIEVAHVFQPAAQVAYIWDRSSPGARQRHLTPAEPIA
jgi:amidophosphoribosyltransferase